ncbi:MAG: glycosyltransferase family 39 protein [Bacteroidetes bacterium]|nr:glycosyltransferase family 39 protein [Bacteroidota bacterium]
MTQAFPIQYCKDILQSDNFLRNFNIQILHEGHPPLYFILLKVWALCFGYSELALRSFSLLCGLLSIIMLYALVKDNYKGKYLAWAILLLVIFNPFLFYYFTEARMYAFAFLLATISYKYWIKYMKHKRIKSFDLLWFIVFSSALLYTHYYGLFFFLVLAFWDTLKNGFTIKLIYYAIPILIFSPWTLVIKIQTELHHIHWTDGSYSLYNSIIGFGNGLISLFFSPMSNAKKYEVIFSIAISILLFYFLGNSWKKRFLFLCIIILYFLQIFLFDKILNHHTIVVPRYYIFILILFYWSLAKAIQTCPKLIGMIIVSSYCLIGGFAIYQINSFTLAPKQMYKQLAGYIDTKHDAKNTVIVVEPGGPVIWGLSYYLKNNFRIISAQYSQSIDPSKKIIYVDEVLGDKYSEGHLNNVEQAKLKLVPFVGVFLYE